MKFLFSVAYVFSDFLAASIVVYFLKNHFHLTHLVPTLFLPIVVNAFLGNYSNIIRKERFTDLFNSVKYSFISSVLMILSIAIYNTKLPFDVLTKLTFNVLLSFIPLVVLFKFIITYFLVKKIHQGRLGLPTLLVGNGKTAQSLLKEIYEGEVKTSFDIVGYIEMDSPSSKPLKINKLGTIDNIKKVIAERSIKEVIIAYSASRDNITKIINELEDSNVNVNITPSMYDILTGTVKMVSIFGAPLIKVERFKLAFWQKVIKSSFDYIFSLIVLFLVSPILLVVTLLIKLNSKGPIFFKQERIGINGTPFNIIKFRTMYVDAEKNGPQLSRKNDPRITPIGRLMRKTRIDELPNFFNVLKGDMSVVGPRPERQFFIDQIIEKAPHYKYLQRVKPGITSWGQVKYGYAQTVDQMVERLKYDILYIENLSLKLDFKILLYTIYIVLAGKGK